MEQITVAVVEDDSSSAALIKSYIDRYSEENNEDIRVILFEDGDEIASDYKAIYNIIFLDIQMKRMDGMSAAECIRRFDKDVIMIFITNNSQYAIKGYSVDALDFLLKPVPYFAFSQQMKRSIERFRKRRPVFMLLPSDNGVVKVDAGQIYYIESFEHKMVAYTNEENYSFISTLKKLEDQLSNNNFCRCSNSYLVNLAYVKGVKGNEVTVGKQTLPISRSRKKEFLNALTRYVGRLNANG